MFFRLKKNGPQSVNKDLYGSISNFLFYYLRTFSIFFSSNQKLRCHEQRRTVLVDNDNIDLINEILSNSTDHSSSLSSVNRPQSSDTFLVL